ncbi:hypothetical protein OAK75_00065 [Bacteriovoracales bacterium]|nr:hypothetical protein [Bacteriovoracales bacterium]
MNKLRIGFDFDNTIVSYESLFYDLAIEKEYFQKEHNVPKIKSVVKELLINQDGHDLRWRELQSLAYGKEITKAQPFPNAISVISELKKQEHDLFIVSHKTEYSNYQKGVNLRKVARNWIKLNQVDIKEENVFFCETIEKKIDKVSQLRLDFFFDDLLKVLQHNNWPEHTQGIHFLPKGESDHKMHLLSWDHMLPILQNDKLGKLQEIEPIKRDGNNRITKLSFGDKTEIIKSYFITKGEKKERGLLEFSACKILWENNIKNIPRPIKFNPKLNVALYDYIEGDQIEAHNIPSNDLVKAMSTFIEQSKSIYRTNNLENYFEAADSRQSFRDYTDIIDSRFNSIINGSSQNSLFSHVTNFLQKKVLPLKEIIFKNFLCKLSKSSYSLEVKFSKNERTLSPSDFGPHNMLIDKKGTYQFLDFEYFGQDDAAKLISDIFHHAGFQLSKAQKWMIYDDYVQNSPEDRFFQERFSLAIDLIGLEWVLIVLNIASPGSLERRVFANPNLDVKTLITTRLQKAEQMVERYEQFVKKDNIFLTIPEPSYAKLCRL